VNRRIYAIVVCIALAAVFIAASMRAVSDDPCHSDGGASAAALITGSLLLGVAAYLLAGRTRIWIRIGVLVATSVVGYFAFAFVELVAFWFPHCAN
jgi:hypothetical protein